MHLRRNGLLAALALPLAIGSTPTLAETIDITLVNGHPPVFRWVKHLSETFIPAVEAALEGSGIEIAWTESYGGSLAKVGGELEAIEEGLAEVGVVPTVFEPAKLPLQNVAYYTPFASTDAALVTGIIDQLHQTEPAMAEAWDRHGLVYLGGGFGIDDYQLFTNFAVASADDVAGKKIGTPGPAINWLKGTEAVGVSGDLTTYYNSLKTGVYDGVIVFATAALPAKLYEVAPHVTRISFGSPYAGGIAANRDWLDAQPEALQAALRSAAKLYSAAYHEDLEAAAAGAMATMVESGAEVVSFAPEAREAWAGAMPNVARDWAAEVDAGGQAGTAILQAYMEALRAAGATPVRNWDQD